LGECLEKYLNRIYNILEGIPQEELIKKASRKLFSSGDLLFNRNGQSIEFNQYNNYIEGETIRNIDWKQYAKTNKLYTKKFHSESNSNAIFIIDTTNSMNFKDEIDTKLEYSILLFGVLSHIILYNKSNVSLISKNNFSGFKKQTNDFPTLLSLIKEEKNLNIIKKLSLIKEIKETRNSTIFIISDFMYNIDSLLSEVKKMKALNYDFYFIQTLTKKELEFDYKGIIKFKDMETSETLITEPLTIKKLYIEELKKHNENISKTLLGNNMKYKLVNISDDIKLNILNLFGI
jgi:uncharacterized protein (DUF58 family)